MATNRYAGSHVQCIGLEVVAGSGTMQIYNRGHQYHDTFAYVACVSEHISLRKHCPAQTPSVTQRYSTQNQQLKLKT